MESRCTNIVLMRSLELRYSILSNRFQTHTVLIYKASIFPNSKKNDSVEEVSVKLEEALQTLIETRSQVSSKDLKDKRKNLGSIVLKLHIPSLVSIRQSFSLCYKRKFFGHSGQSMLS